MTAAVIYRWTPKDKFSRVYVAFTKPCEPRAAADKDAIWEQIKRDYYSIDEGFLASYWDSPEEEAEERESWFKSWDDIRCWEPCHTGICVDSHY